MQLIKGALKMHQKRLTSGLHPDPLAGFKDKGRGREKEEGTGRDRDRERMARTGA